jgi:nitroimidazol reductase NimA-like FMN-containing flavoprotein (pyridoxamine 5'-phosphate oxidase superfamily)
MVDDRATRPMRFESRTALCIGGKEAGIPMSIAMSKEEREAFLAEVHVGVIGINRPARAPLTIPIWYSYERGADLWIMIESDSLKERLLKESLRFTLCAQDETPPFYKFVSVEGPVISMLPSDKERDERAMAVRYLGPKFGDQYVAATKADPTNRPGVIVTMRPETWISADFAKQFGTPTAQS